MQLRHINTIACPDCGSPVSGEAVEHDNGKPRVHTCGEQWEVRTFACGLRVHWIPNFSREERQGECLHSPKHLVEMQEQRRQMDALKGTLDGWENQAFARLVWSRVSYLTPSDSDLRRAEYFTKIPA